jgi:hypothetical protein
MKSSDAFAGSSNLSTAESVAAAREERRRAEEVSRWATVVSAAVVSQQRLGVGTGEDGAPANWRQDVGAMTASIDGDSAERPGQFGSRVLGGVSDATGGDSSADSYLQLRVDAGDLGEVALVVERQEGGLRLTVGAASEEAFARFSMEIGAMREALGARGLAVTTLQLVRMDGLGTVPALGRPVGSSRPPSEQEAARRHGANQKSPKRPRLNLRG